MASADNTGQPHRIVCTGWAHVTGSPAVRDVSDYDAWYYLNHVGEFAGRNITYTSADMVFPSYDLADHWASLAIANEAADANGIVPVLRVEPVENLQNYS